MHLLPVCILITAKLRTHAPASVLCSAARHSSCMDKSLLQQRVVTSRTSPCADQCVRHRHQPVWSVVQSTWTHHCCSNVLQVAPRPVLTNVALQVPVLASEASSAQLEADLLKCNLQLNHCRLHLAELVSFHIHLHVSVPSCDATCSC